MAKAYAVVVRERSEVSDSIQVSAITREAHRAYLELLMVCEHYYEHHHTLHDEKKRKVFKTACGKTTVEAFIQDTMLVDW